VPAPLLVALLATKDPGEGTGLGLATVYGIITGVGGAISLYFEPERRTTVRALFPALDGAQLPDGPLMQKPVPAADLLRQIAAVPAS
jgi:hypothetical protein